MYPEKKDFKQRLHESLKRLPGVSMRISDNGSERAMGDFLYWNLKGNSYLIKCRSTKQKSLPFAMLRDRELEDLRKFNELSYFNQGMIAIHFELDDRCVLLTIGAYRMLQRKRIADHASIPESLIISTGYNAPRYAGIWNLANLV